MAPDRLALIGQALAALQQGAGAAAKQAAEAALALDGGDVEALYVAGLACNLLGLHDLAVQRLRQAVAARPKAAWRTALARTLIGQRNYVEADHLLQALLAQQPDFVPALLELAFLCLRVRRFDEAADLCRRGLVLAPQQAELWNILGHALIEQGDIAAAGDKFEHALALRPDFPNAASARLFCLHYRADLDAEAIRAAYRQWERQFALPLLPQPLRHDNAPLPQKRLKLGYVSADFHHHVVAHFFEPLLLYRDRQAFEVHLYADVSRPDAVSERLRAAADGWHVVLGMTDAALAEKIRADGIDILIDLAGHTAGNRLGVFARKPAPVQFSYLIGQGASTGLSAIDGFFADEFLAPPGSEHLFSERIVRLGRSPLVYVPPQGMPDVGPLPALRNGHLTFGCFSRIARLNGKVLALWAALLRRLPDARLVLNSHGFAAASTREEFVADFAALGIAAERLDLIYTFPQARTWAHYNEIDIALDPFPHNAGTTTIEALWMGVPVLSKADRPSVGRFGASILGALGMSDWVSEEEAGVIAIAERWARDLDGLAALRAGLRPRFAASPMRDGPGLARAIEAGYRQLWRDWCALSRNQS